MNKEELLAKINQIPLFAMKDVAVKQFETGKELTEEELETNFKWIEKPTHKAITEIDDTEPLAFVCDKYKLVQFKEMFEPIVNKVPELSGDLVYHKGKAIMDIFPKTEEYKLDDNPIGIVAYNSVDKTCALNIRFCIKYGERKITIPRSVAGFRKVHLGKIGEMTQDYINVITKIKNVWVTINNQFTKHQVTEEELPDLAENFGISDRVLKKVKKYMMAGKQYNLWDFCMEVFNFLSTHKYKSDVHKRERLDKFVNRIFDYGFLEEI